MFGHDDDDDLVPPAPVEEPDPVEPWDVDKVIDFLSACKANVRLVDGAPVVTFPANVPPHVVAEVVPHMRECRGLIIDHYFGEATIEERDRNREERRRKRAIGILSGKEAEKERKRLISEARRPFLFLKRDGRAVADNFKPHSKTLSHPWRRTVTVPLDREATHVMGANGQWVALPKVTSRMEDAAFEAGGNKAKAKARRLE